MGLSLFFKEFPGCYLWTFSFIVSCICIVAAILRLLPCSSKGNSPLTVYEFVFFLFSIVKRTDYFKSRYFPLRRKLPKDLITPGVKSSYQNHSNLKVIQKFCHCSQLSAPLVRGVFKWLKRFYVVWCLSSFSVKLLTSTFHTWRISLIRQLFESHCFYPSSEITLSSYNRFQQS